MAGALSCLAVLIRMWYIFHLRPSITVLICLTKSTVMKNFAFLVLMIITCSLDAQMFTKVTNSPLSTTAGDSRSVNWVDANGDGYIDCFITNGPQAGQNNMLY